MRNGILVPALLAAIAVAAPAAAPRLPAALGIPEADARGYALDAFAGGSVAWWAGKEAFLAAPPAARVALVEQTLAWAKAFVASPAFAQGWAARRAAAKPEPPAAGPSVDAELAAQQSDQQRALREMKAMLAQLPADQRPAMAQTIKEMEATFAAQAKDAQLQGLMRQGLEGERAAAAERHREDLARWERDLPADGRTLVARRLREFLAACDGVVWDAKLRLDPAIGKQRFVDTRLEAKPAEWKLCYRAGREPTEAARRFATAWLAELPR